MCACACVCLASPGRALPVCFPSPGRVVQSVPPFFVSSHLPGMNTFAPIRSSPSFGACVCMCGQWWRMEPSLTSSHQDDGRSQHTVQALRYPLTLAQLARLPACLLACQAARPFFFGAGSGAGWAAGWGSAAAGGAWAVVSSLAASMLSPSCSLASTGCGKHVPVRLVVVPGGRRQAHASQWGFGQDTRGDTHTRSGSALHQRTPHPAAPCAAIKPHLACRLADAAGRRTLRHSNEHTLRARWWGRCPAGRVCTPRRRGVCVETGAGRVWRGGVARGVGQAMCEPRPKNGVAGPTAPHSRPGTAGSTADLAQIKVGRGTARASPGRRVLLSGGRPEQEHAFLHETSRQQTNKSKGRAPRLDSHNSW